jgi:membrane fusion protein (multidrug efflux system)
MVDVAPDKGAAAGIGAESRATTSSALFRQEALDHARSPRVYGDVLRVSPVWARRTYAIVVASVAAALVYAVFGTTYQYASGPALVRIEGRRELTARAAGIVSDVYVQPGQRVRKGDVLARFYSEQEQAELDRIQREFDARLLQVLRNPADKEDRQAAAALEAERQLAERKLGERSVVAPEDAIVSDVHIHPGQAASPGDPLLVLAREESHAQLVAVIPAQYRPMLHPGMSMRLELTGFRYIYRDLTIASVGDLAIGQSEVRRYLGPDLADTISVDGPVVLVHATIPSATFEAQGQSFLFHDGMPGRADIRVRAERIIMSFIPGLRSVLGSTRE